MYSSICLVDRKGQRDIWLSLYEEVSEVELQLVNAGADDGIARLGRDESSTDDDY